MMSEAIEVTRDESGRFLPGQSGNPAGKRPGTRNRKTALLAALRDGEDTAVARTVIDNALAGDAVAARFVLGLIAPKPKGRTIQLDLPEDECNVVAAFNATLRALCAGEITPDEAVTVSRFLDGRLRVLQAWELEEKLTSFGRTIPGDPVWADHEPALADDDDDWSDAPGMADARDDDAAGPDDAAIRAAAAVIRAAAAARGLAGPEAIGGTPRPATAAPATSPTVADLHSTCILQTPPAPRPGSLGIFQGMLPVPAGGFGGGRRDPAVRPA